jgi:hypothetical protein
LSHGLSASVAKCNAEIQLSERDLNESTVLYNDPSSGNYGAFTLRCAMFGTPRYGLDCPGFKPRR